MVRPFILPPVILLLWFMAARMEWVNPYLLPPPERVFMAALDLARRGDLTHHMAASLGRVFAGFGLTILTALPLAVLKGLFSRVHGSLRLVLEVLRVTPPLALVPLLILWLGIGEASKLAVVMLASFFPVYMNTLSGLTHTDRRLIELGTTLELTRSERVIHILLPAALPGIVTGLRLGFGYSWRALVGAELIAASAGLGYLIIDSSDMARTDRVMVGILAIAGLGALTDGVFRWLADRLMSRRGGAAVSAVEG